MVHILPFSELSRDQVFRIMEARSRVFIMEQRITVCPELDEVDLRCLHVFMDNDDGDFWRMPAVSARRREAPTSAGCSLRSRVRDMG